MAGIAPRNEIEGLLAVQMLAAHNGIMRRDKALKAIPFAIEDTVPLSERLSSIEF